VKGKTWQDFLSAQPISMEMPLVAETAGIWHWWPVNTLLMVAQNNGDATGLVEPCLTQMQGMYPFCEN
jgi:hypothetical protein